MVLSNPINLQVVLAVDQEQEHFVLSELKQWGFFGLQHQNVLLIPLPRFPGFAKVTLCAIFVDWMVNQLITFVYLVHNTKGW